MGHLKKQIGAVYAKCATNPAITYTRNCVPPLLFLKCEIIRSTITTTYVYQFNFCG